MLIYVINVESIYKNVPNKQVIMIYLHISTQIGSILPPRRPLSTVVYLPLRFGASVGDDRNERNHLLSHISTQINQSIYTTFYYMKYSMIGAKA